MVCFTTLTTCQNIYLQESPEGKLLPSGLFTYISSDVSCSDDPLIHLYIAVTGSTG